MKLAPLLKEAGYSVEEQEKIESACKVATFFATEYGVTLEEVSDLKAVEKNVALEKSAGMSLDETEEFMRLENAGADPELAAAVITTVKQASALLNIINTEIEEKMNIQKLASLCELDAKENCELRIKMATSGFQKEEIEKIIRGNL